MSQPPPVVIKYLVDGLDDALKAMKSIQDVVTQTERKSVNAAKAAASEKKKIAEKAAKDAAAALIKGEQLSFAAMAGGFEKLGKEIRKQAEKLAKEKIAAMKKADREADKAWNDGSRRAGRAAREEANSARKAALDKIAAMKKADKEHDKAVSQAEKRANALNRGLAVERNRLKLEGQYMGPTKRPELSTAARRHLLDSAHGKSFEEQQKILEKARSLRQAAQLDRAARKREIAEADAKEKEISKKLAAEEERRRKIRERSATMAGDFAKKQAAEEAAARKAAEKDLTDRRKRFAENVYGKGATALGNAAGVVRSVGSGVLNVGGGYSVEDSLQRRVRMRGALADISNRAVIAKDPENAKRVSVDELQSQANAIGNRWAIDPEAAVAGLDKFAAKTGNLARGRQLLSGLAEMSRAGAGSLDDLADAAGDVFNADHKQNADQVLTVMRALAGQGKLGAVEMKDLATQMAALQAAAGRFQGDAGKNMAMMGALAQLSRESGGSRTPAQATQAVTALTAQLYKDKRLESLEFLGVQTKDEKTGFNLDLDKIIFGALSGAEKRSREGGHGMRDFDSHFTAAFKDQQAQRAVLPLAKAYKEHGGGEEGLKAARELLQEFVGATQTKEEIAEAAANRMKEADIALEQAMQKLRATTADELVPVLSKFAGLIERLVPTLGKVLNGLARFAEWFANNPFSGFAALVTGFFLKELAAAQIASTIKSIIAGAMPTGGGMPGMPGVAGPGAGAGGASLAAVGLIGAGAALQVGAAGNLLDNTYGAVTAGQAERDKLLAQMRSGNPNDADMAKRRFAEAQGQASTTNMLGATADTATRALNILNPFALLGQKAGDWAAGKAGVKTSAERTTETLKANEIINAPELKELIAKALVEGAKQAAGTMPTKPPNVPSQSIADRYSK